MRLTGRRLASVLDARVRDVGEHESSLEGVAVAADETHVRVVLDRMGWPERAVSAERAAAISAKADADAARWRAPLGMKPADANAKRLEVRASIAGQEEMLEREVVRATVLYSPDNGASWRRLGVIGAAGGVLTTRDRATGESVEITYNSGTFLLPDRGSANRRVRVAVECRERVETACRIELLRP